MNWLLEILIIFREYLSWIVNLLTNSHRISDLNKSRFQTRFILEWCRNRLKVLPCKSQHCLGLINTLTTEGCSETWPFWHLNWSGFAESMQSIQCSYLKNQNLFVEVSWWFWNLHKILKILRVCKIIDCERGGYLNVKKVLFQNTLWQSTC